MPLTPKACQGTPRVIAFPNSLCIGCLGEGVGKASNDENVYCKDSFSLYHHKETPKISQSLMPPKPNIVNIAESLLGLLIEHEWFLTGMWVISKH